MSHRCAPGGIQYGGMERKILFNAQLMSHRIEMAQVWVDASEVPTRNVTHSLQTHTHTHIHATPCITIWWMNIADGCAEGSIAIPIQLTEGASITCEWMTTIVRLATCKKTKNRQKKTLRKIKISIILPSSTLFTSCHFTAANREWAKWNSWISTLHYRHFRFILLCFFCVVVFLRCLSFARFIAAN